MNNIIQNNKYMKKKYMLFVLLMPLYSYTQTQIYIEPTVILSKLGFVSTSSLSQMKLLAQPNNTQLQTHTMRLSNPTVGLAIGANFADGKRRLSLGINLENVTFGYDGISQNERQGARFFSAKNNISYTRWHVTFEQRLSNSSKHKWYVMTGIGITFNNKNTTVSRGSIGELQENDTIGMMMFDESRLVNGDLSFSPSFTIGLKADFYSQKGKYLISSSLFYTHGIDNIAIMDINHIAAVGSKRLSTWNSIYSKGSGITLQVSRRLNLQFQKIKTTI